MPSSSAGPIVALTPASLDHTATEFQRLGKNFSKAMQESLNACATSAVKRMEPRFQSAIDGGPAPFTKIKPGAASSSVIVKRGTYSPGAAAPTLQSEVAVRPVQSQYLKYLLGEKRERDPGDAGVAEAYNFVPMLDKKALLEAQGIKLKLGQNIGRGLLKRLFKRERDQRAKLAAAKASGQQVRRVGALRYMEIFFGRVKRSQGFFVRPADHHSLSGVAGAPTTRPALIVLAVKKSRYPHDYLVPAWNASVTEAAETLPMRMERRLRELTGSGSGGPPIV